MPRSFQIFGSMGGHRTAAYGAALGLICIQVGIGIVMKASQTGGQYAFSPSGSVVLSEFFKLLLSTFFFYKEHQRRKPGQAIVLPPSERSSTDELTPKEEGLKTDSGTERQIRYTSSFWETFRLHVPVDIAYGFAQLALLYALINNLIFVAYKLADPGTISLTRAGVTLITALVMVATLGSKINKIQWIAILMQICGLVVTQYQPGTGTSYPLPTYLLLGFQVFLSAISGVYNQKLLKQNENSSLNASNMALYAGGVTINLLLHITIRALTANEPGFFSGYDSLGAVLVVVSNVFIGIAITAVYKYADAVIKCLATAVATGILLYISPVLFGTELSALVLPGTVVVLVSSYLYMEGGILNAKPNQGETTPSSADSTKTRICGKFSRIIRIFPNFVLALSTFATVVIVMYLNMQNFELPPPIRAAEPIVTPAPITVSTDEVKVAPPIVESPFKNHLGFVRWNSEHPERMPLLRKYAPFFHELHFSMPNYVKNQTIEYHNLTHDSWENAFTIYVQIAKTMQLILDAPPGSPESQIEGLVYWHFDAWIDPLDFADENFNNLWIADIRDEGGQGPIFECMTSNLKYPTWWPLNTDWNWQVPAMKAAQSVAHFGNNYNVNVREWCTGWSDFYHIPRRLFPDYIFLARVFGGFQVFHEITIPTILHIMDRSRRLKPTRSIISRFGDCWGSCCTTVWPDKHDLLFHRCGHKLPYPEKSRKFKDVVDTHYGRLEEEAEMLGSPMRPLRWMEKQKDLDKEYGKFSKGVLEGLKPGFVESNQSAKLDEFGEPYEEDPRIVDANRKKDQKAKEQLDRLLKDKEENEAKAKQMELEMKQMEKEFRAKEDLKKASLEVASKLGKEAESQKIKVEEDWDYELNEDVEKKKKEDKDKEDLPSGI